MRKKLTTILLAMLVAVSTIPVSTKAAVKQGNETLLGEVPSGRQEWVFDEDGNHIENWREYHFEKLDGYYYLVLNDGTVEIDGYTDLEIAELEIPSKLNGKRVTVIGEMAFNGYKNLKKISIPDGVTRIDAFAFLNCENLENITIPDSVIEINIEVFRKCSSLKNIILPKKITVIARQLFDECTNLKSITIPKGVKKIERDAFFSCTNLKSISIPDTVTTIEESAFWECKSLKSISLPKNLTEISCDLFEGCESLKSISIPKGVKKIGTYAFCRCKNLYRIKIKSTKLKSVEIYAFWDIKSNAVIEVPAKKYNTYKKLLKESKLYKKVKIIKAKK